MFYSEAELIGTNEKKYKKKIKIKDETQLLGALYNCILRNDTDNEGLVCLSENIGFFLNFKLFNSIL